MDVLAPFLAIVVAGVSERIQSDSANQPVSPRRKCAASATYWVAVAISRECEALKMHRRQGKATDENNSRGLSCATRSASSLRPARRRAEPSLFASDSEFATLPSRASQLGSRDPVAAIEKSRGFLDFSAIQCWIVPFPKHLTMVRSRNSPLHLRSAHPLRARVRLRSGQVDG